MSDFEIKKISENKYYLNLIKDVDGDISSNGLSFDKNELYKLYMKLRDIFSNAE
jgi:hypothetical protein